jgi:signal transduction histidine kinase
VREAWKRVGLRGKMAISIGVIVLVALGLVLLGVRREVGEAIGAVLLGGTIGLVAVLVSSHLLDEAFSRQRQFVSDASHELRTPLTAIRGQLEVLARRENPEASEVRRVTDVALAEMTRIERLVEDLLTLARLDEEAPLRPLEIPLEPFLRRFGEDPSLGEVTLGELPAGTLRADPDGLTQVIRNLLANARRHAGPEGRVELSAVATGRASASASSTVSTAARPLVAGAQAAAASAWQSPARSSSSTKAGSGSRRLHSAERGRPSRSPASSVPRGRLAKGTNMRSHLHRHQVRL